jgi:hypothetical protein
MQGTGQRLIGGTSFPRQHSAEQCHGIRRDEGRRSSRHHHLPETRITVILIREQTNRGSPATYHLVPASRLPRRNWTLLSHDIDPCFCSQRSNAQPRYLYVCTGVALSRPAAMFSRRTDLAPYEDVVGSLGLAPHEENDLLVNRHEGDRSL